MRDNLDFLRVLKQLRYVGNFQKLRSCIEDTIVCEEDLVRQLMQRSHSTQASPHSKLQGSPWKEAT